MFCLQIGDMIYILIDTNIIKDIDMYYKNIIALLFMPFLISGYAFQSHLSSDWYPKSSKDLNSFFSTIEQQTFACSVPVKSDQIAAIVVPHAGYRYSGDVAAVAYQSLDATNIKKIIILAPSHAVSFKGITIPSFDRYSTPLGSLMVDIPSIVKLKRNSLYQKRHNVWKSEHALEVQLPFISRYVGNTVKIVPLIVGTLAADNIGSIARSLADIIDEHTLIVISSDFIHYGSRFAYTPFNGAADVQSKIKELDNNLIATLLQNDTQAFAALQEKTAATICGREPLKLFKIVEQLLPYQLKGKLVCYKTSYDVDHIDPSSSVSYAAIIFEREQPVLILSAEDKKAMLSAVRKVIAVTCDGNNDTRSLAMADIQPLKKEYRGLFVTLRKKNGDLRGCMGRVIPDKPLDQLLPDIAQLAAFSDPRFPAVSCKELADLRIEISILSLPFDIKGYQEIVLGKHGIILTQGGKSALFLPQVAIEQHWDLPTTLRYLSEKAGLPNDAWQQPTTRYQLFEGMEFSE